VYLRTDLVWFINWD